MLQDQIKLLKIFYKKWVWIKELRDNVFTSGEAALNYLKKNFLDKKFYHIGPPRILIYSTYLKIIKVKILKIVNIYCVLDCLTILTKI